jgi:hypothetical protein
LASDHDRRLLEDVRCDGQYIEKQKDGMIYCTKVLGYKNHSRCESISTLSDATNHSITSSMEMADRKRATRNLKATCRKEVEVGLCVGGDCWWSVDYVISIEGY